jgi:hypothetical protein
MNSANNFTKKEIEEIVVMIRLDLYNRCLPCGPEAIRKKMEEEGAVISLPSKSTIGRILSRECLTHGRTGWYAEDYPEMPSRALKTER